MPNQSNNRSASSSQGVHRRIDRRVASVDGDKLLVGRQSKGLTQEEVAEKAGIDLRQVKQAEGHNRLMVRNVPLLSKVLGFEPEDILIRNDSVIPVQSNGGSYSWEDFKRGAEEVSRLAFGEFGATAVLTFPGTSLIFLGLLLATLSDKDALRAKIYTSIMCNGKVRERFAGFKPVFADQFTIFVPETLIRDRSNKIIVVDDYITSGGAMEALRRFFKKNFDLENVRFACCVCYDGLQARTDPAAKMPDFVGIQPYADRRVFGLPWGKDSITFEDTFKKLDLNLSPL